MPYLSSSEIRKKFLDFFESKGHKIVKSAPIVIKDDPTLMFTNAGMNQFKDYFLGDKKPLFTRIADTQKCLRVSGKHNDLEEVGVDTYHHTMFEMLGNWSFGDYFKKEAIAWSWELLTEVYQIPKDRLYVTVFEGDSKENIPASSIALQIWQQLVDQDKIVYGNKKDNFWEMGDIGPCGPCTEIHVDCRPDEERQKLDGKFLVNKDHPQVIEIWNNVFMQYNRKADGSLEPLPQTHVDTGMGFERLVRVLQGKSSNYDTDIFQTLIVATEQLCFDKYGKDEKKDIAFRVISDHIRAVAFAIADGQLPSNNGAGYVIRRILRRAVRYGYSNLGFKKPFMYSLVFVLANQLKDVFEELEMQKDFVSKVIQEEELSFFNTLGKGIDILNQHFKTSENKCISGKVAFELFDTFGFPIDLTKLIASENNFEIDEKGYQTELELQKNRSRAAATKTVGDWIVLRPNDMSIFTGYTEYETQTYITKYRSVETKEGILYQLVLNTTPFFAESGGQVGDTGVLIDENNQTTEIINTLKENDLNLHIVKTLPKELDKPFKAIINKNRRQLISENHSATHLAHAALKQILGNHIAQKGSLVNDEKLRFDFSHFSKIEDQELSKIETLVNQKIKEGIVLDEKINIPIDEAKQMGATALFGEKYGDTVRVITFDPNFSMELCGGTHIANTSQILKFKIVSESSVAAGIRRIEAVTHEKAEALESQKLIEYQEIIDLFPQSKQVATSIKTLINDHQQLKKNYQKLVDNLDAKLIEELQSEIIQNTDFDNLIRSIQVHSADSLKNICFHLKNKFKNSIFVLTTVIDQKPYFAVSIGDELLKTGKFNAGNLVKEWSKDIDGGGGGQAFYAMASGKKVEGLVIILQKANTLIQNTKSNGI